MPPDNCKVHFVITSKDAIPPLKKAKVRYLLVSAYKFIKDKEVGKHDFTVDGRMFGEGVNAVGEPWFRHRIIDSGLFTLMFGVRKAEGMTYEKARGWMHRLIAFAKANGYLRPNTAFVECDCQKIVSPQAAWDLRQEMRLLLPGYEIINVFHLDDGEDGLRRLVDFSDYIAISVPELRLARPKSFRLAIRMLAREIIAQKPTAKIHLLGCTEPCILVDNDFVTSCDSSSWNSPAIYGSFDNGRNIYSLTDDAVSEVSDDIARLWDKPNHIMSSKGKKYTAGQYYAALQFKRRMERVCGPQD